MQITLLDSETSAVVQAALWGLMVISILLTLRAIDSGNWLTMWVASLVSLTASLVAIWSIGSLTFLLTCLQVAAAVALQRSAGFWNWIAFLLAGVAVFGLVIYGLAFVRAWDLWLVVIPLAFALTSLLLIADLPLRRREVDARPSCYHGPLRTFLDPRRQQGRRHANAIATNPNDEDLRGQEPVEQPGQ
ncbi:MAG: hypothetical protein ACRDJC_16195 [Thermomicrobiales bacterium]